MLSTLMFVTGLLLLAAAVVVYSLKRVRPAEAVWAAWAAVLALFAVREWSSMAAFPLNVAWLEQTAGLAGASALGLAVALRLKTAARVWRGLAGVGVGLLVVWMAGADANWAMMAGGAVVAAGAASGGLTTRRLRGEWRVRMGLDIGAWAVLGSAAGVTGGVLDWLDLGDGGWGEGKVFWMIWSAARLAGAWWLLYRGWRLYRQSAWAVYGGVGRERMGARSRWVNWDWQASAMLSAALVLVAVCDVWLRAQWNQEARGLERAVALVAAGLDGESLAALRGQADEVEGHDYRLLRRPLLAAREQIAGARFVYTAAKRDGKMVYLVDAEPADSEDFSPPGTEVESDDLPMWRAAMAGRGPIFSPPAKDEFGVWVSAFAPVRLQEGGQAVALVGVDLPALEWHRRLLRKQLEAFAGLLFLAGALGAGFLVYRSSLEWSWRVGTMSRRLETALAGADMTTWELSWQKGRLALGEGGPEWLSTTGRQGGWAGWWRRIHREDRRRLREEKKLFARDQLEKELRVLGADGSWRWVLLRGRVIERRLDGAPVLLAGTLLDIDATHRAREALDTERELSRQVMLALPVGLMLADGAGRISYANAALLSLLGQAESSVVGMGIGELIKAEDPQVLAEALRAAETGGSHACKGTLFVSDTRIQVELRFAPQGRGGRRGVVVSVIDLRERMRQEEELRRSREEARRLALVAQRTDNGVVITDAEGRVEWVNAGFTRITGYAFAEVKGLKPGKVLQGPDTDPATVQVIREALRAGLGFKVMIRNYAKNGRGYFAHIECQPLRDERSGELAGFMAMQRDVTREHTLENELRAQRERLEAINRRLARLGDDFFDDVQSLTELTGELFGADSAFYNRLEGGQVVARGSFQAPEGWRISGPADGRLSADMIRSGVVFRYESNLGKSVYADTDSNIRKHGWETYVGRAVRRGTEPVGALSVVFKRDFKVEPGLQTCLELIAQALEREEALEVSRQRLKEAVTRAGVEKSRLAALISQLEGAVIVEDRERRVVLVNQRAVQMLGPGLVAGADCSRLVKAAAPAFADALGFTARVDELMGEQREAVDELEMLDGRLLRREFAPVRIDGADLEGYLWHYRDVTQERRTARVFEAVAGLGAMLVAAELKADAWGEIVAALGKAAGADRAYVFHRLTAGAGEWVVSQLAEWNSGVAAPQIENPELQNLAMQEAGMGRWVREFEAGRCIVGAVADFPAQESALLAPQEILSMLVVPVPVGDRCWGFVGFDACRETRAWADWEVALLRSVTTTIGLRLAQLEKETALRHARDEAEAANRAKSAFLATMSHEIRTPLNAVIGMATLVEETALDAQQQDYVRTILNSGQALLDLINNILDYSKIESGKIELERAPFHLSVLCAQACDILRGAAQAKQVELVSRVAPGTPDYFVGDSTRVRQVVLNLLSNAVKFTERGSVTVELALAGRLTAGGMVPMVVTVRDTGIGMPEDVLAKLFQAFTQGDSSTTRRFGGTGLGLVITRRLVETMGGEIVVGSVVGEGTTFTVNLPLMPVPAGMSGAAAPEKVELRPGLRVLAVDDLEVNRTILGEWLRSWGVDVELVAEAETALERLKTAEWDLLLTDFHMPGMDGAELARRIAAMDTAKKPVVVMLSSDSVVPADARKLCAMVLLKPVWPEPLKQMLGEAMRRQRAAAAPPPETRAPVGTFPLRVLVAEDNPNNQRVITLMLRRQGIIPVMTANGREAVEAAAREPFDLALLDMQMPELDGLEAARRICAQQQDPLARPLLAAFTANVFSEDREAARQAGMTHYVTKPVTAAQLTEVLQKAEEHRARRHAKAGS